MAEKDAPDRQPSLAGSSPTPSVIQEIPSGQKPTRWDINPEGHKTTSQSVDG